MRYGTWAGAALALSASLLFVQANTGAFIGFTYVLLGLLAERFDWHL
jgi:hypothetical protein